jgi:predicted PurR-regulated permease PerM
MKRVNLQRIILCERIALACVILAVSDYAAAYFWQDYLLAFVALGVLANITAICASLYPKWKENREFREMLRSDNGNFVDPV